MTRTKPQDVRGFELDTGGVVRISARPFGGGSDMMEVRWSDISPFEQGYVEGMLSGPVMMTTAQLVTRGDTTGFARFGFRDLAPSTLAAIRKDCSEAVTKLRRFDLWETEDADAGRRLWIERQAGNLADFPPLTLSLGEDGKVYAGVSE